MDLRFRAARAGYAHNAAKLLVAAESFENFEYLKRRHEMWKKLSEELPGNITGVLYNERYDEVYEMDRSAPDEVVYVVQNAYGEWVYVAIKPCDYDQWWWCEKPGRRD